MRMSEDEAVGLLTLQPIGTYMIVSPERGINFSQYTSGVFVKVEVNRWMSLGLPEPRKHGYTTRGLATILMEDSYAMFNCSLS